MTITTIEPPLPGALTLPSDSTSPTVKKAVIPVAGLATRLMPASLGLFKGSQSLYNLSALQRVVLEATSAGVQEIIFVVDSRKSFQQIIGNLIPSEKLIDELTRKGKIALVGLLLSLSNVSFEIALQPQALGLGHAVLCARNAVSDEPFFVLLPDDLPEQAVLPDMLAIHERRGGIVLCLHEVPQETISAYGVVAGKPMSRAVFRVENVVEKPQPEEAPSNWSIVGRYLFTPRVFDILERLELPTNGGEIALTEVFNQTGPQNRCYGLLYRGKRHDIGTLDGLARAQVAVVAKENPYLARALYAELGRMLGLSR